MASLLDHTSDPFMEQLISVKSVLRTERSIRFAKSRRQRGSGLVGLAQGRFDMSANSEGNPPQHQMLAFHQDAAPPREPSRGVAWIPIEKSDRYTLDGPALVNVVYIALPALSPTESHPRLVTFAAYDEALLRDKYNEALRIVGTLGASEVKAWNFLGSSVAARAGVKAPQIGGFSISGNKSELWEVTYEQQGDGGSPEDPRPLRYPHEPGFDSACHAVLSNGARFVQIEITRQSQFNVEGELAGQLKKVGFELGFTAIKNRSNVFSIAAKFPDRDTISESEPALQTRRRLLGRG